MGLRTPIVAIVGRPNVGKSTLFNRLLGEEKAVVQNTPGVTRDRNYAFVERYSIPFIVVDTGGFAGEEEDELRASVREQAMLAVEEADVVVVLFDGNHGVAPDDGTLVDILRRQEKPVHYVVNKCDGPEQSGKAAEFYELGLDELLDASALHGHGVSMLVETVLNNLPNYEQLLASYHAKLEQEEEAEEDAGQLVPKQIDETEEDDDEQLPDEALPFEEGLAVEPEFAPVFIPGGDFKDATSYRSSFRHQALPPKGASAATDGNLALAEAEEEIVQDPLPDEVRIAIIGRPNVGKSTLLNTLCGERRAITSPIAGTTRDALDLIITRDGQKYLVTDTAGLRKRGRVSDSVEQYSNMRALRALSDCDVAILVIDAERGPELQDSKIAGMAHEIGRGLIIAVNKWDLVEKNHKTAKEFERKVREEIKFAKYAPIIFISAKTGRRCPSVIEMVREVALEHLKRVQTGRLNRILERAIKKSSPPVYRGRRVKLYFASQIGNRPPRFVLFFNYPKGVHFSYMRYLKNAIREEFGFLGTEIKLLARKRQG